MSWLELALNFQSLYAPTQRIIVNDLEPFSRYLQSQLEQYRAVGHNYSAVFCYETSKTTVGGIRKMVISGLLLDIGPELITCDL